MSAGKSIRKPWSADEDEALLKLIAKYGTGGCWPQIATMMDSRTGKQCRERYINHLDPDMKKTPWTIQEDDVIRQLFPEIGTKWSQYMPSLPGRSDNAIKNRYHVIARYGLNARSRSDSGSFTSGHKRSFFDGSTDEADSHHSSDSDCDLAKKRLKRLQNARDVLDRTIRDLQEDPSAEPTTVLNKQHFQHELGADFAELQFLWEDDETINDSEPGVETLAQSSIDSVDLPPVEAFDFTCYEMAF